MTLPPAEARGRLRCSVARIDEILPDCLRAAEAAMTPEGIERWLDGASLVCGLGRGTELVLIFLEEMPGVAAATDEAVVPEAAEMAAFLSRVPLGAAVNPFLSALPAVARRLESAESLREWFRLVRRVAEQAPDGMVPLLRQAPHLAQQLSIGGLANWIDFGLRAYREQPHRYPDFFALQTADAHAALHRERHGTLLVDHERQFKLTLRALWGLDLALRPYSVAFDILRKPTPHIDKKGFHLPDVLDDADGVGGIERYRAMLAHMAAHKLWSRPFLADNFSPFQHLAVEAFEDARVEALAVRRFPGLRRLWLSLHPLPVEGACPDGWSCIRHKLAMLSRALLDPGHPYADPTILRYVAAFHDSDLQDRGISARLGVQFLKDIHDKRFHSPKVWFADTIVPYRDDNRWLWHFLEEAKREEEFHSDHGTPDPVDEEAGQAGVMPPQHYPEWDYQVRGYRPDWATVYEAIQTPGNAAVIDAVLDRHKLLARQIRRLVDRLKPQRRRRIRRQAEGDEFDLDQAVSAVVDWRAGVLPDTRIYQRHVPDGRDIAVLLLLDLSESIKKVPDGAEASLLRLSQEAVTLLGEAVWALGDPFAVVGFASDTRHQVRYLHYKGFHEAWGPAPKARLAAMAAGGSTRMGAALRHAGRYLERRREEKKLLLLLSDGEPSDVDVDDPRHLKWDAHAAVGELRASGINSFCITLDDRADDYVADIFGSNGYAVVDRVDRLPEKLPRLFMALTGR